MHARTCLQVFVFADVTVGVICHSAGIRVLQSTASCGPGEIRCAAVTEQLRGGECQRVGAEISCVAHAARGER